MKKQVVMSKKNGNICVAIPLFQRDYTELDFEMPGQYSMVLVDSLERPIAYALDIGDENCVVWSAKFVEEQLEFLGDL